MVKNIFDATPLKKHRGISALLKRMQEVDVGIERLGPKIADTQEDTKAMRVLKQSRKRILQKIQEEMKKQGVIYVPISMREILRLETKKQKKVRHAVPRTLPPLIEQWIEQRGYEKSQGESIVDFFNFCAEKPEKESQVLCKRNMSLRIREMLGLEETNRAISKRIVIDKEDDEVAEEEEVDEDLPQGTMAEGIV